MWELSKKILSKGTYVQGDTCPRGQMSKVTNFQRDQCPRDSCMEALTSDKLTQIDFFYLLLDIMILIDYMENEKKIMQTAINL